MKRFKKITAALLAAVLVFSFAACSKSSSDDKTEKTAELKDIQYALIGHRIQIIRAFMLLFQRDIIRMQDLMYQSFSRPRTVQRRLALPVRLSLQSMHRILSLRLSPPILLCR